jgi:hypothetical protein
MPRPWPTGSTWTSRSTASAPRSRSRARRSSRASRWATGTSAPASSAGRRPTRTSATTPAISTGTWWPRVRFGSSSRPCGTSLPRGVPRPQRSPEDPHLRQGRLARRGHPGDRPPRVWPGERLRLEDHLQDHRAHPEAAHPRLPHGLLPPDLDHRRSHCHGDGHQAHRGGRLPAHGEEQGALRADEGPGRPDHRPQRPPGRQRQGGGEEDPLPDRGLCRGHREPEGGHPAARAEAGRVVEDPARARRLGSRIRTCSRRWRHAWPGWTRSAARPSGNESPRSARARRSRPSPTGSSSRRARRHT